MDNKLCPLCLSNNFCKYKLGLIQCIDCDFIFSPTIWQDNINENMEKEWFSDSYESKKSSFWVHLFEKYNNYKILFHLRQYITNNKRLLEIGVGSGSFLIAAINNGYDAMGCDISAPICKSVKEKFGIRMHCGQIASLKNFEKFDIIIMKHVLEHVTNPVDFLKDVSSLLSSRGIVYISVPNIKCWEAKLSGWNSYEPYHLTYFEPTTLSKAIEKSDLKIIKLDTKESFSGWFLSIYRSLLFIAINNHQLNTHRNEYKTYNTFFRLIYEHPYRILMILSGILTLPLRIIQEILNHGDEINCIATNIQQKIN